MFLVQENEGNQTQPNDAWRMRAGSNCLKTEPLKSFEETFSLDDKN